MNYFKFKEIKNTDMTNELANVGFVKTYINIASEKYMYKNFKIFDLTLPQANILKQTAISFGADCGVHRDILTANTDKTDCILGGSVSTIRKITKKLKTQPFKMKNLAEELESTLDFKLTPIKIKNTIFDFSRPYIVGVVNVTTNSFSDGGDFFETDQAKNHILKLIKDGADIIELGAESTKPFSTPISPNAQIEKLLPLLKFTEEQGINTPISIDTRSAEVAKICLDNGANIINDVSGFEYDSNLVKVVAEFNCPVIIQHTKGTPENMQVSPHYENVTEEIFNDLKERYNFAIASGISSKNVILDVGIGFGKTREDNFELIKRAEEFKSLNCPIMYGVSRKSLLDMQNADNKEKDIFTLALNSILIERGVNFIRVHNVELHKKLINMLY
ncbi:dihydropteroate synthase [bacterium]|nr:dihydropteroate synthase [bacterium]